MQCKCGSYAINHHCHGRDGSDDDLCDVCYWRKRAEQPAQQEPAVLLQEIARLHDLIKALTLDIEFLSQPAQQQEPVAWMTQARNFVHLSEFTEEEAKLYGWKPIYTSPPQRTWVGLTDDDLDDIAVAARTGNLYELRRTIEAKLKEKNNV